MLYKKQLAKVDEFEEMLKRAVGTDGRVKNVGKDTYDVSYKNAVFSVLKNKDGGLKIMKFFCSKRECERRYNLPFDVMIKEAEQLDFSMSRVPMYGKSIIMDIELEESRADHRAVRNIMEQVITANDMLKERALELKSISDDLDRS